MGLSAEQRAKISAALKGRSLPLETRLKMSAAKKGVSKSPAHREAMRLAYSDERRAQMRAKFIGTKHPERGPKISAAKRGKPRPDMRGNDYWTSAPVKGECIYCLRPAPGWDHLMPRSRGGTDDPENMVPCCNPCNASKGERTPEEWLEDILTGRPNSQRHRHVTSTK